MCTLFTFLARPPRSYQMEINKRLTCNGQTRASLSIHRFLHTSHPSSISSRPGPAATLSPYPSRASAPTKPRLRTHPHPRRVRNSVIVHDSGLYCVGTRKSQGFISEIRIEIQIWVYVGLSKPIHAPFVFGKSITESSCGNFPFGAVARSGS
jgi:hypothetical protein